MDHHTYEHAHESPPVMLVPLIVLAVGAVVAGFLGLGMVHDPAHFFDGAIATHEGGAAELEHVPFLIGILPLIAGLCGIALAYVLYIRRPDLPARIATAIRPLYIFSYHKWFFDELYDVLFVRTARLLGLGLWRGGDEAVIDRFGPDGVAATALAAARRAVRLQTGYVYHYAFAMLIGVAALVTYYFVALRG
jgi:NADH-quinone oxidoreductase subunit L